MEITVKEDVRFPKVALSILTLKGQLEILLVLGKVNESSCYEWICLTTPSKVDLLLTATVVA